MITLRDVAEREGVSISTVSLVLNGHAKGRVKADIAARIRKAADEMRYVPNHLARSLSTNRTATVGLVSDQVATIPFAGHMLAGAQQVLWDEGYLLMLIDTAGNDEITGPAALSLIQRNVEALILAMAPSHGLYRWHLPDPIYFAESIRVTLQQIGAWQGGLFERSDDVCSTAYWYQSAGSVGSAPLVPARLRRPR